MYEVVCMFIEREGPLITGVQILQKLNSQACGRAQGGDAKVRTEHVVQMFLLCAVIVAFTGNSQTKKIAVEFEARVRIGDCDCSVIDVKKYLATKTMLFGIAFPFWK